jgi:hypothetical protein
LFCPEQHLRRFINEIFQDSGVVVSEASQGSIEVLDKSTTSQWSVSEAENASGEARAADAGDADPRWDENDKQPDSMTPDEAEILLSSRYCRGGPTVLLTLIIYYRALLY